MMAKAKQDVVEAPPRARIIQAAQSLFAAKGVHGTALREIAREAGINVNLVSYYFPNKEDLFDAVVDGKAAELNEMRETLLQALEDQHSPTAAPVERIVYSLVHPFFALRAADVQGWTDWQQMLNRETGTAMWGRAMARNLRPVLRRYANTLHRALPRADRADILFVLELSTRAMVLAAEVDQASFLPDAVASDWTDEQMEARVVRSLTAAAVHFAADSA